MGEGPSRGSEGPRRRSDIMEYVHLIYRRLPDRVLERWDRLIDDLGDIIVAESEFYGMLAPLYVNGVKVIDNGYRMIYFAFIGENYDILKVYDADGNFRGFYVDILGYTKRRGNIVEMLDLFLDILIFPDGDFFLLDEDELEMALNYEIIDRKTFDFAIGVANNIIKRILGGNFPPEVVYKYDI